MANEKRKARINELIKKVLEEKQTLDDKEMKELKALLKALVTERETKKGERESLSEVIERSVLITLSQSALDTCRKVAFENKSLEEKVKYIEEGIDKIENSSTWSKLKRRELEKKKQEDFEAQYAEHVRKYGNDL
ncbi:hypothetical protein [Pseudobacillus badius]|uniref:hypothetical protein n=1 Tax=Bacillus badius TaxID=1455 RepID=UPI0007B361FE|nr:hypothetical protein [Bacillus badius]KZR56963.1 hypothetical protein A3781_04625 [Bacillus badius]